MFMTEFIYPAYFESAEEGGFIITFPDIGIVTQAETLEDAYDEASDCLEEAIAAFIVNGKPIPKPGALGKKGYHAIPCSAQIASKAALYLAMKSAGMNKVQLAERLGCDEKEVRRMLDPKHATKIYRIEAALHALGKRVFLSLEDDDLLYGAV
jgi:antitoxin HicB